MRLLKSINTFLLIFVVLAFFKSNASSSTEITIHRNGIVLKGKFFTTQSTGISPVVILLHGFPGNENDVLGLGNELSNAGFNVLTFNYSGTYNSQGQNSFKNTQDDIKAAYDFVLKSKNIEKFKIDTSQIYLGGWSYGGGMALTYASKHQEIKYIFSIAGTDHGEFMREYKRNPTFRKMIDDIFSGLTIPSGPVNPEEGYLPQDIVEIGIDKIDSTLDLRNCAPLLAPKDILLIGGWDDTNVTIDKHIFPFYRALMNAKAKNTKIIAFQDEHSFSESRLELAEAIIKWLKSK